MPPRPCIFMVLTYSSNSSWQVIFASSCTAASHWMMCRLILVKKLSVDFRTFQVFWTKRCTISPATEPEVSMAMTDNDVTIAYSFSLAMRRNSCSVMTGTPNSFAFLLLTESLFGSLQIR